MNKSNVNNILQEIEKNHNHSWYEEIYKRNKDSLNDIALFYRGNSISYGSMFDKMKSLAIAMNASGVNKGTEIPVCMSNTPELIYVMGAASMIGAKINVFSANVPGDYVFDIIENCNSDIGFFEDNFFIVIREVLSKTHLKKYVLYSLQDSLPKNTNIKKVIGSNYVNFSSNVSELSNEISNIVSFHDFLEYGQTSKEKVFEQTNLDDEFSITYTSGSTNAKRPKAIVHTTRSFIVVGRFHDADLMYGMHFKKFRCQAIVPPYSNTDLISCISDALMQGACLTLEPVYNKDFFLDSLLFNRPNYIAATRSFWIAAAKKLMTEDAYKNKKLPFLTLAFSVGEELTINEERFLNKTLRKADAGKDMLHIPISLIKMCVAGGDCEHGAIFYRLFRSVSNFSPFSKSTEKRYGMSVLDYAEVAVLDEKNNRLGNNKFGRLVANSPCTMKCYKNDISATNEFFVKDNKGVVWADMSVYGHIDNRGRVYMRGRIKNADFDEHPFKITDDIIKNKCILSCEVVAIKGNYIVHYEFDPLFSGEEKKQLTKIHKTILKKYGTKISNGMFYRKHTKEDSFILTGSGKRDFNALIEEGISPLCQKIDLN